MNSWIQTAIVVAVVIAAAIMLWREMRRNIKDDCDGCPIADRCGKHEKRKHHDRH
ncbi:MAG: FeoB-associated Cys-rich membrane protein [Bacteroidales bacterium]|nr:FeoB-associated Cys-rich membrane protein [Bacteroidales bacterium]